MSRAHTNCFLDDYEQAIDKIVAACDGDLRGALRALLLSNEQLEQKLQLVSAELIDHLSDHPPQQLLH